MKPEASQKPKVESQKSDYTDIGVPEEWVEPLKALGYDTIDKIKAFEKPGKLHQEMMGYRKKNKLDLPGLSPEVVAEWIKH